MTGHDGPVYTTQAADEASVQDLGDKKILKKIAQEHTLILKASASVDWYKRKSVRAAKRMHIQIILSKLNYPPHKSNEAMELVLNQSKHNPKTSVHPKWLGGSLRVSA